MTASIVVAIYSCPCTQSRSEKCAHARAGNLANHALSAAAAGEGEVMRIMSSFLSWRGMREAARLGAYIIEGEIARPVI